MAFLTPLKALLGDRVGEEIECRRFGVAFFDAANDQVVFLSDHLLHTLPRYISLVRRSAVDRIAEVNVTGGHCPGDGSRGDSSLEEPEGDFLTRANFNQRAVLQRVKIDG